MLFLPKKRIEFVLVLSLTQSVSKTVQRHLCIERGHAVFQKEVVTYNFWPSGTT